MPLLDFAIGGDFIQETRKTKKQIKYSITIGNNRRFTATILPELEIISGLKYPLVKIKKYEIRPTNGNNLLSSYEGQGYFDRDGILHNHGQGKFIQYMVMKLKCQAH
jgi:hypothetical protein